MVYEVYLKEKTKLEGNTRHILYIFKFMDHNLFEPFLVSPVYSDFFKDIALLDRHCYQIAAPASLSVFGGAILRQGMRGSLQVLLDLVRYNRRMLNFLRRHRPDIIHCHNLRALLMVGLAAKAAGIPVVWYIKGLLDNPFLDCLGFVLSARVLFQNEANRDNRYLRLIKHYARKISILHNGIDLIEVKEAERKVTPVLLKELGIDRGNFNIIFMGRVSLQKGTLYLLEAMAAVQAAVPRATLYLVGDNSGQGCLDDLKKLINRYGLQNIHFIGWRQDCYEILALMDLLVLPSLGEGVPKAIIEAMALGKPVVATRVGGIPELVQDGETGLLVAPQDSAGLAQAIIALARQGDLRQRLGARAREVALAKYSIQDNIAGLEKIYAEILQERQQQN